MLFVWSAFLFLGQILSFCEIQPALPVFSGVFVFAGSLIDSICSRRAVKKLRHVLQAVLAGILFLGILRTVIAAKEEMYQGYLYVSGRFLELVNRYYKTSFSVPTGFGRYANLFLNTAAAAVILFLGMIAVKRRKSIWIGVFPAAILAAGLCIGIGPEYSGLLIFVTGIVLSVSPGWKSRQRIGASAVLTGLLCLSFVISMHGFSGPALRIASKEKDMLKIQKNLEKEAVSLISSIPDIRDERISNEFPEYENKEVLRITSDKKPRNDFYLRGTYSDTYESGVWKQEVDFSIDRNEFFRYEDYKDLDPSKAVADEGFLACQESISSGSEEDGTHYTFEYTDLRTDVLYLPYLSSVDSIEGKYRIEGDYQFKKTRREDMISVRTISDTALYQTNESYRSLYSAEYVMFRCILDPALPEYEKFYEYYNSFAEESYLTVPDQMTKVKEMAEYIKSTMVLYDDSGMENLYRLEAAGEVRDFLRNSFSYEKELPDAGNRDPVEFFLEEGNGGFCVHFASAGTLLLRELGVPARYVSGFYVTSSDFSSDDKDGFTCSVKDSDAHAWVEIYLENYGWIPVDMTPGYGSEGTIQEISDIEEEKPQDADDLTESDKQNTENLNAEEPDEGEESEADQKEENSPAENSGSAADSSETDSSVAGGTKSSENRVDWSVFGRILLIPAASLAAVFCVWRMRKRRQEYWNRILKRAIRNRRYSRAAKLINQRIYQRLMRKQKLQKRNLSNQDYLLLLKQAYPEYDWDTYMEIMRKAVYSAEELKAEEFAFIRTLLENGVALW